MLGSSLSILLFSLPFVAFAFWPKWVYERTKGQKSVSKYDYLLLEYRGIIGALSLGPLLILYFPETEMNQKEMAVMLIAWPAILVPIVTSDLYYLYKIKRSAGYSKIGWDHFFDICREFIRVTCSFYFIIILWLVLDLYHQTFS